MTAYKYLAVSYPWLTKKEFHNGDCQILIVSLILRMHHLHFLQFSKENASFEMLLLRNCVGRLFLFWAFYANMCFLARGQGKQE